MEHWHRSGTALLDEIAATHLPASQLAVWYIGQCGFLFKCGETTFCIDPVLSDLTGPNGSRRRYPAPFAPGAAAGGLCPLHPRPRRPHGKGHPARPCTERRNTVYFSLRLPGAGP